MGQIESLQFAQLFRSVCRRSGWFFFLLFINCGWARWSSLYAQKLLAPVVSTGGQTVANSRQAMRARRFLNGRTLVDDVSAARAMDAARSQHVAMLKVAPRDTSLSAAWQPVGPAQVASTKYGNVTGRVTAIAIDPADTSGNTVYLGTTGGGVWKSTNAAGPAASVNFTPLTDTIPVFSGNAESVTVPSLSIGAVSVQSGVILAGTGDPNDASDSFYGSGLLRSTDGGLTWTLIRNSNDGTTGNHSFAGLGFAGFAWSSPTTVVAALSQAAEGTLVNATNSSSVMGLYYSTDAGVTWQMGTIVDGSQIVQRPQPPGTNESGNAVTAVVWNPIRQRFYAAVRFHGYYESADGITWTRLGNQPGTGLTMTACPSNPNGIGNATCPIFRGALAVQPVTGDTFALTVDSNNVDQGLWQDKCALSGTNCSGGVAFGTKLDSTSLEIGSGSAVIPQADYNMALSTIPSGSSADTLLYAGTIDLFRCSLASGCSLRNTTNAGNACDGSSMVAPAQHAIAVLAGSTQPPIYIGNDGGVWRSLDGANTQGTVCSSDDATHFQNLNSGLGSLAEVISFAQDPTGPGTVLAGLGANGTAATSSATSSVPWTQLSTGEGGTVAIDPSNPLLWYVSTGAGVSIRQCATGANCTAADFAGMPTVGPAQVEGDVSLIDAPWLLDPALPSNVVIGTCRVWRGPANDGTLWSSANAISATLAGAASNGCASTSPAVVRSLGAGGAVSNAVTVQNSGSTVLYAGMAGVLDGGGSYGGHIFSTVSAASADNATVWTDIGLSPVYSTASDQQVFNPGDFDISAVVADAHDSTGKTIYATVMGFSGNSISAAHLYRSVDGGAHWTNISGNLPNAPANSVVVDPNDANTVYVALDTGVYVTTQVTSCSTSNCWSVYGTSLPNAPVISLQATSALPTGDGRQGELRAATYGRGIWQIPLLTASTTAQPVIALSPAALSFPAQAVATMSAAQTITVTNAGVAPLAISSVIASGDFNETDTCTASAVAVNATCTIQVRFLPSTTGDRSGVLTVYGNVAGGQATASLAGTGTPAAAVVLNPITVTFPSTLINSTSAVQNITISNTGGTAIGLKSPSVTGDFKLAANTCGASLAASTGCTVAVAFSPTVSGTRTGSFSITDDAGMQTASLNGIGISPATDALSPAVLAFASQPLGTASAGQVVTLTNSGDVALTLIAAQITSGDFAVVNSCGNSLNAHSSCSMSVTFAPTDLGARTGVLSISDVYRTQAVALSGTGIAPRGVSLAPTAGLQFPATGVGLSVSSSVVTLTNNTSATLAIANAVASGDFSILAEGNTCGGTVAAESSCTLQIAFTPTASGPRNGTLTIADSSPNSPHVMQLSGTGVGFALDPNGPTTVTITSGQNAVFPLLLSPAAGIPGKIVAKFTCAGVPQNATCNVTPSSVGLDTTTTISVTVLTGVASSSTSIEHRTLWFAAFLPVGLLAFRRRRLRRVACLILFCCLAGASGCGSGRLIPGAGGGGSGPTQPTVGTPPGTYAITVSAASAGLTQTVNLTLIVQ
jgi:Abnormal spindle-like microcephaly-assoc'd, ASPM-SPD-2-Hydin